MSVSFCLQEKSLPGVVMALVCNVFEMLYQLANLDESRYVHPVDSNNERTVYLSADYGFIVMPSVFDFLLVLIIFIL